MPEWLKGADCKSAALLSYVGSNPTQPNLKNIFRETYEDMMHLAKISLPKYKDIYIIKIYKTNI